MTRLIVHEDPDTGIFTEFEHDELENKIHIINGQRDDHVRAILEANRREYNDSYRKHGEEFRKVATIPNGLWPFLERLGFAKGQMIVDRPAFERWLNDSDNRAFRTNDEVV